MGMIDAEVVRLRALRDAALRMRAIGKALDADEAEGHSLFARGALLCWSLARLATGRLRAHPFLSYQRGPSPADAVLDRFFAGLSRSLASKRGRRYRLFADELQLLTREVRNARALTLTPDLSDSFGRILDSLNTLSKEAEACVRDEAGLEQAVLVDEILSTPVTAAATSDEHSPYLNLQEVSAAQG